MSNLPCEECTKTSNHCCVADIPYHVADAMYYKNLANHMGIECMVVPTPNPNQEGMVVLVQQHMEGKDIHFEPCIFLKDRKCSIYENRPTICRSYGTASIPCIYERNGYMTLEQIASLTQEDMNRMTKELEHDLIFEKIMNGEAL